MNINAEKLYLAGSAVLTIALLSTPASATKPVPVNTIVSNPATFKTNTSYTASGKMDKKMAVMLINLLRNPHLQVRAEVNGRPLQTISPQSQPKNPMNILANYTITGKTDRQTVLKLKRMLQSGRKLQINAQANFKTKMQRVAKAPTFQQPQYFTPSFTPFYSNVTPPTYVQGNIVWVPVLINKPLANVAIKKPEMIATN